MIIDNREKDLIKLLIEKKIEIECQNLELGDIVFTNNESKLNGNEELIMIERKTVDDLMASIKDGRHREQKIRLLKKQKDGVHIYYLIEGSLLYHKKKETLYSSILNTMMRDNIKVIFSRNIEETITYLIKMSEKLDFCKISKKTELLDNKSSNDTVSNEQVSYEKVSNEQVSNEKVSNQYLDTIKSCKKENLTKEICYQAMLKQIPGVSTGCAESISKLYPSFNDLLNKYKELENEDEKKHLLSQIMIKKRKIGNKLSEKIYQYLI